MCLFYTHLPDWIRSLEVEVGINMSFVFQHLPSIALMLCVSWRNASGTHSPELVNKGPSTVWYCTSTILRPIQSSVFPQTVPLYI